MPDPTIPPAPVAPQLSQQEIDGGKTMAILAYIPIALVGLIVSIVCISNKNNAYSLYHSKQALTLYICWVGAAVCCVPLFLICIGLPLLIAVQITALVFCILGIVNASSGKCKPLPLVGRFADKWFGKVQKA
jgi:uncharacterized membrane protein